MEKDLYMLSLIQRSMDTLKSVGHSILKNVSAPTTPLPLTETFACTTCDSSETCDGQSEYCMTSCVDTDNLASGINSTRSTLLASSQPLPNDNAWATRLRDKYGIATPMADE